MDPLIYKVIHLAGVMGLFAAIGTLFASDGDRCRKLGSILHGVSLVLILVAGFGLLAKLYNNQFSGWVIAKLVIWVALGATLTLAKKKVLPCGAGILIAILLGTAAAYLGIYKPF